jgi:transcriptional regulator with XRE-family HTH domain
MTSSDHQVFPLVTITAPRPAVTPKKKAKTAPVDSESGKELAAIRAKLGITNSAFASRLGIGLPTLSSYLYNRVQNVPERVMTAARAMIADGPTDFDRSTRLFGDVPMSTIVGRWDKVLGIDGNADADKHIAFALKVDPITVWRWRTDAAQPQIAEIAALDRRINKFASLQSDSN